MGSLSGVKGENHPRFGKHHSEESKKKISDSMKGKYNARGKHWEWKNKKSQKTLEN